MPESTTRPVPPPLVIADIPCPACQHPTGYDAWRRRLFCNYCGITWATSGMHTVGDELPGQWAGVEVITP